MPTSSCLLYAVSSQVLLLHQDVFGLDKIFGLRGASQAGVQGQVADLSYWGI